MLQAENKVGNSATTRRKNYSGQKTYHWRRIGSREPGNGLDWPGHSLKDSADRLQSFNIRQRVLGQPRQVLGAKVVVAGTDPALQRMNPASQPVVHDAVAVDEGYQFVFGKINVFIGMVSTSGIRSNSAESVSEPTVVEIGRAHV